MFFVIVIEIIYIFAANKNAMKHIEAKTNENGQIVITIPEGNTPEILTKLNKVLDKIEEETITGKALLYTIDEASKIAKISRSKIYQLIKAGKLAIVKIGNATRIRNKDLIALAEGKL